MSDSTAINLMELNDAEFIEHVEWHISGISPGVRSRLIALSRVGAGALDGGVVRLPEWSKLTVDQRIGFSEFVNNLSGSPSWSRHYENLRRALAAIEEGR